MLREEDFSCSRSFFFFFSREIQSQLRFKWYQCVMVMPSPPRAVISGCPRGHEREGQGEREREKDPSSPFLFSVLPSVHLSLFFPFSIPSLFSLSLLSPISVPHPSPVMNAVTQGSKNYRGHWLLSILSKQKREANQKSIHVHWHDRAVTFFVRAHYLTLWGQKKTQKERRH